MIQVLYIVVVCFLPFAVGGSCPSGWAVNGDYCYLLSPTQWDFDTGRSVCQDRQADLVSFQTVEEREFVKVLVAGTREEFWIGAKKDETGNWIWTDGTLPGPNDDSIKDWDTTAECPDNCEGDCVQMNHWNGLWTNVPCTWSRRYVCKRKNDIQDACDFEGGWNPYSGMCYKYLTTKKTWQDAERDCVDNRGHLAVLNTPDKFSILEEIVACKDYEAGVWIGLSDTASPPEYKWADNSLLTDANWDTDQPKNQTQPGGNCVNALTVSHYKWRVDICDRENEYACERAEGTCAEGWTDYGTGFCYTVVGAEASYRKTWTDAHHFCTSTGLGGQLMKIDSDKQQGALKEIVSNLAEAGVDRVFIGLSDVQKDNDLRWADGSSVGYSNFGSLEKVVRRIDCGFVITADANATWNTGYCFEAKPFICQIPIHKVPSEVYEPSGWRCPDGWEADNRTARCFQFPDVSVTYQQALSSCTEGKLLVIQSMDEQSFLSLRLKGRTWIGYEYKDGMHQWYDNSPVTFENWQQGGFDNSSSMPCTVMSTSPPGAWVNEICVETRYYICAQAATHVTATTVPTTPTAPWTSQCGSGWSYNPTTQACYRIVQSPTATWENAQLACQDIEANLVSIHGEHETAFINGLLNSAYTSMIYWIGANDRDQSKGWQWSDGSPFFYLHWNDGEPNDVGGTEWCVELSTYAEGRWNDVSCDHSYGYICKKVATTATPMPSVEPTKPPVECSTPQPLLSGYHYIRDIGFTASSYRDGRLPSYSRLNHNATDTIGGSWTAADGDSTSWVGVLFTHYVTVMGVVTQGAGDKQEWVIDFSIMYRLQYGSFYEYVRNGSGDIKVFSGNSDANTAVQNMFDGPILAHSVRIYPSTYNGAISLRFELLGCVYETCETLPLVSGESMVPNERMTASGSWDDHHLPDRARLHYVGLPELAGGWVANSPWTVSQWHQVEFDTLMTLYAVQTKGREDYPQWITKYKLFYTNNLAAWETYQEPYGYDKILTGNSDQNTLVTNWLNGNIYKVKYVRINAQEWVNGIAMRMEILGCHSQWYGCTDIPMITGENSYIPNSRLTASSTLTVGTSPSQSRLNTQAQGETAGAWMPFVNDAQQWIQADLGRTQLIVGVATQGRQDNAMFVTLYKLSYSNDASNYVEYQFNGTAKLFPGNWDQNSVHKTYIDPAFKARYVKLHPVEWNVSIALRWEIYACAGWAVSSEIGCYADVIEDRDLTGPSIMYTPEGMTRGTCVNFCVKQGYIYAGLQWGQECFCGNSYGRHGPSDDCNYPCTGDPTQQSICGGDYCNSILTTGTFSSNQVIGCYSDAQDRDLPFEHYKDVPGGNTLDYCAMHCFNKGYRYAGAQFGSECYCGNSYGQYGPSTRCNMACPGDYTGNTTCGGEWSNTVMSTGIAADEPQCRDGWIPYESNCYLFTGTRNTWNQARTNCHQLGSELATVNSARLNDFILSQMTLLDIEMWIGLHCLRQNNYFEWASGDPVLYTNWNRREPNSAGQNEDCVMLYKNGLWNDDPCDLQDRTYGYVCELPKEDIPDASTPIPDTSCPEGWKGYRWKCFTAGLGEWIWSNAKGQCESLGGSLARIEDSQEQAFLSSTFGFEGRVYWTDLSETNGQFMFSNGQPPSFTHWGQGQPADNGGSGCVIINMTEYGLWQSISCSEKPYAICEVAREGETKPSTVPTQPAQGSCANGWQPLGNNYCFLADSVQSNMKLTWSDALASCRQMGADLVSIHSMDEENQIRTHIMSKSGDFWIGLNAIDNTAGFVWSDGSPVDFEYWTGPGLLEWRSTNGSSRQMAGLIRPHQQRRQPSLHEDGKDCVDMYQATGTWNAIECNSLRNWICKIQKGISPTLPTTTPAPSAGPPGSCAPDSDDWKFFNGRCYLFTGRRVAQREADTSEFNWYNAENACRQYGGHLASLHTEDEQRFVEGQINSQKIEAFNFWMGLTDMNNQQSWQWSDGTPTEYINWGEGEPNNEGGMELCAAIEAHIAIFGSWTDKHCENTYPFICVKAPGGSTVTTPAPTLMPGNCPSGYLTYANKCFQFFDEEVEWNMALEKCQQTSAKPYSLASISDPWENAFLQSQIADRPYDQYWIGLYQFHGGNGEFGWIDNAQVTYTNWAGGEPNGGLDEGCVEMLADISRAGLWNDHVCSVLHPYICMQMKDPSIVTPPPDPANDCPSGYALYRGNCYKADATARNWQNAEDQCKNEGGHLASVANGYEMGFLISKFKGVANELWIGLTDKDAHGRYAWSDGTTTSYTYWGAGKPELTDGGCVYISYSMSGYWADAGCDSSYGSICQITRVQPPYTRPPEVGLCPSDNAGDNWIEFGGYCYLFRGSEGVSQADAGLACQTRKSALVSIHSEEENQFIYTHLQPISVYPQWIGLLRSTTSEFIWSDGTSVAFFNWDAGEPNNGADGDENCVEMVMGSSKWNDITCKNLNGYVCKKPQVTSSNTTLGPATTPPTVASTASPTSPPTSGTTPPRTTLVQTSASTAKSTVIEIPVPTTVPSGSSSLSTSAIVGIVFGCVAIGMILVFIGLMYLSRKRKIVSGFNNPTYTSSSTDSGTTPAEEGHINYGTDSTA